MRRRKGLLDSLWGIEPTTLYGAGLDGSSWVFEGGHKRKVLRLEAWCPGNAEYYDEPSTAPHFAWVHRTGRSELK